MANKQRRLIIFAPGWGGIPPKTLNPLLMRFREGFDIVSLKYPWNGFGSLETNSRAAWEQVKYMRPGYEHITWIGHSMGGLLPWLFEENIMNAFVSMGTPFNGSLSAMVGYGFSPGAREMLPGSKILEKITSYMPNEVPLLLIKGKMDFVTPNAWTLEPGPLVTHLEVPCGHLNFLNSKRVFQEIWAWLVYGQLKELGHEDTKGFLS